MHLYVKFQQLCAAKGVEEAEAYQAMKINKGTVSTWRTDCAKGIKSGLSMKTAQKMADYFGISVSFFADEGEAKELSAMQADLSKYTKDVLDLANEILDLDEATQDAVRALVKAAKKKA